MAELENCAKPILLGMMLGETQQLQVDDQAVIATWAHKTALTAMLASSSSARAATQGLPAEEYRSFADRDDRLAPLPDSRFWVARHIGQHRMGSVWVTPLAIETGPTPTAVTGPVAYSMTIAVADLLIHGLRFTNPLLAVDVVLRQDMVSIWPAQTAFDWNASIPQFGDDDLAEANYGRLFRTNLESIRLAPDRASSDLPASELRGSLLFTRAFCGLHEVGYPSQLALDAIYPGIYHCFVTNCDCGVAYLYQAEADGVHMRLEGEPTAIAKIYKELPWNEEMLVIDGQSFFSKMPPGHRQRFALLSHKA
jgi:hypothetical protein